MSVNAVNVVVPAANPIGVYMRLRNNAICQRGMFPVGS